MPGLALNQWGPGAWNTLHAFAHTAPRMLSGDQIVQYRTFLYLFADLLPCPKCRSHFKTFLDSHLTDTSLSTRDNLVAFLNDAHNEVNRRTGKPTYTLDQHYAMYSLRARVRHERILAGAVVIAVTCIVVFRSCQHRQLLPALRRSV